MIGNKILEFRKKNNLTQEELAEKMEVARQTISKWELNETSPDLKEASKLSKIFNISLDELTGSNNKNEIISSVKSVKKITIANLLITLAVLFVLISLGIITSVVMFNYFKVEMVSSVVTMHCTRDEKIETYEVKTDKDNFIVSFYTTDEDVRNNLNIDIKNYTDANQLLQEVKNYVISKNAVCE